MSVMVVVSLKNLNSSRLPPTIGLRVYCFNYALRSNFGIGVRFMCTCHSSLNTVRSCVREYIDFRRRYVSITLFYLLCRPSYRCIWRLGHWWYRNLSGRRIRLWAYFSIFVILNLIFPLGCSECTFPYDPTTWLTSQYRTRHCHAYAMALTWLVRSHSIFAWTSIPIWLFEIAVRRFFFVVFNVLTLLLVGLGIENICPRYWLCRTSDTIVLQPVLHYVHRNWHSSVP